MSLKGGLERLLGAPCYHMIEVFPRPAHFGLWTGVPVPAEPFPHVNSTDEFQARIASGPPPGH